MKNYIKQINQQDLFLAVMKNVVFILLVSSVSALTACSSKKGGGDAAAPAAELNEEESTSETSTAVVSDPVKCGELSESESVTRTRFQAASVKHGNTCIGETQTSTCASGTMSAYSGSYSHESCVVNSPTAPQIDLKTIILEQGYTELIDLADMQSGAPSDDGVYYYNCYFDNVLDEAVATVNDCSDFQFFQYDFLFNGNGEAEFDYSQIYDPGTYEFYIKSESEWGATDSYIPVLVKEAYKGGENLVVDLDARYADRSSFIAQTAGNTWGNIAANSAGESYALNGTFSSAWTGTGIDIQDPYSLQFSGNPGLNADHLNFGDHWNNESYQSYSLWFYGETHTSDGVLLANKADNEGFTLIFTKEGKLKLNISDDSGIADYSTAVLADNPIAYWPLDQFSGSTVSNLGSSGSNLDAVYDAGTPNFVKDSRITESYSQDVVSQDDRLVIPGHADMFDFTANGITVEMWVKSNTQEWSDQLNFISKRDQFILGGVTSSSAVRFYIRNGTGWVNITSPAIASIDSWHHYAATYDGTTAKIYVDGIEIVSGVLAGPIVTSNANVSIGTDNLSNNPLNGRIHSVAIYDKVLDSTTLVAHATSGLLNRDSCSTSESVVDKWMNPVVTMSPGSSKLYLNGEFVCEIDTAETGKSHMNGSGDLTFGANLFGGSAFKGKLASLKIYTESLSASEVGDDFSVLAPLFLEAPETIRGLVAWYDASHSDSIILNGAQVSTWQDRSLNQRHLSEENPGTGAITVNGAASPTGLDTIHFNGMNGSFLSNYNSSIIESAFGVYRYDGGATFTEYDGIYSTSAVTPLAGHNSNANLYSNLGNRYLNGVSTSTHADIQVFNQASTISSNGPRTVNYHRVGTFTTAVNRVWHGDIAEIIVYSRALNSLERARIEAYQKAKWGTP